MGTVFPQHRPGRDGYPALCDVILDLNLIPSDYE